MARIKYEITEQMLWYMLAELFFIDSDPSKREFDFVAESLLKKGWTREKTRQFLIEYIAPAAAGGGIKYYLWPAIAEWGGIDRDGLARKIEKMPKRRAKYPKFLLRWIDRLNERLLLMRGMDKFLRLLDPKEEEIPLSKRKQPRTKKSKPEKETPAEDKDD